jgi:hypothetical protein
MNTRQLNRSIDLDAKHSKLVNVLPRLESHSKLYKPQNSSILSHLNDHHLNQFKQQLHGKSSVLARKAS